MSLAASRGMLPYMENWNYKGPQNPVLKKLMGFFPERFQLVYTSPHHWLSVYRVIDPHQF